VEAAYAGQRTAVNLSNVKWKSWTVVMLLPQGALVPSRVLDVKLILLNNVKPLKNRSRIRFYVGASEVMGRVVLLDRTNSVLVKAAMPDAAGVVCMCALW